MNGTNYGESGLLHLIIPKEFGGIGESWTTTLKIVRDFAKVDSSIAHVFSYHHLGVVAPHVFGNSEQKERYYTQTVKNNWFWCNALNPLDRRVILTPDGNTFRLNGTKSFCSGSIDSDVLPVTAVQEGVSGLKLLWFQLSERVWLLMMTGTTWGNDKRIVGVSRSIMC
jgi:alkylation response protein AidB-like acyl-CoA dehydrogenase